MWCVPPDDALPSCSWFSHWSCIMKFPIKNLFWGSVIFKRCPIEVKMLIVIKMQVVQWNAFHICVAVKLDCGHETQEPGFSSRQDNTLSLLHINQIGCGIGPAPIQWTVNFFASKLTTTIYCLVYPLSYGVAVRERYGSTLLPATREQHDQNCTQSH